MDAGPNPMEGSSEANTLTFRIEPFKHEPLDHTKASIRLLQIRADLSCDGLIQCSLRHTTISSTPYSCLSYRWGEPLPSWKILINGRPYRVGGNLYDFLDTFRQSRLNQAMENIWIDAMCIAQNDILERNHQVTQMGEIFSTAKSVYVWLGRMPSIAPIVSSLKNWQNPTYEDLSIVRSGILSRYLPNNEYWNRAWITQEFLLARHAVVFLDSEPMEISDLLTSMKSFYLLVDENYRSSSFSKHMDSNQEAAAIAGLPLLSLLCRFQEKRCSLPQDRVFSLLSLCSPTSRIAVDYNHDLATLACNVLANSPDPLCLCEIMTLLHDLDLLVDPATESLNGADPRSPVWEGMFVDVDLNGAQLPRTMPWQNLELSGRLIIYGRNICPVLEEVVVSCARKALKASLTTDQNLVTNISTQDIPFIFRKLRSDLAQSLCQAGSSIFTVETTDPRSRKYTLRIPMNSIVNIRAELRSHCPTAGRGATWHYQRSKFFTDKESIDTFRKQLSDPMLFDLASQMTFEDCYTVYELLADSLEISRTWGQVQEAGVFHRFLADLDNYLRGEVTIIPAKRLKEAITEAKRFAEAVTGETISALECGYGPCRFVCPREKSKPRVLPGVRDQGFVAS